MNIDIGNVGSIVNMLRRIGVRTLISDIPDDISQAEKLILPGVGAFGAGMEGLKRKGLVEALTEAVMQRQVPILGVCLGMQLLAESSKEASCPGLGWIRGKVVRLRPEDRYLRVPHMGWNTVKPIPGAALFDPTADEPRFYFAHSFYMDCADRVDVVAEATYGFTFPVAVQKRNVFGVQFHPEKSHRFGREVLRRFSEFSIC
ncbi:imidazole glycerol phosphate synthase subunit HisH [Steroidobacter denitrificans]|uniref:imidazole glycerol phosphate synthase subunit HisH n=1 Tax=Steroidobacter denitrificans TaxID=465721 RepID=UPI001AEF90AE|nr:imidazole glycerol phosphate synthase subunit HisH [Steroidobacter denitrificans]